MRKYEIKGYMIVHGQKIQVLQEVVVSSENLNTIIVHTKMKLKISFEKNGNIAEYQNCLFEKDACSGFFVEVEDIGNAKNIFKRMWLFITRIWPFQWKKWKQEY